jgi:hypothetical protein
MRQAAVLANLAEDDSQPDHVRAAARWWMRQGGAVRI